jgi:hypothetical protein
MATPSPKRGAAQRRHLRHLTAQQDTTIRVFASGDEIMNFGENNNRIPCAN